MFVDDIVLGGHSPFFNRGQVIRVCEAVSRKFSVILDPSDMNVVGSAKLGYGLFEKKMRNGDILPAFRPFRPDSDIDLAVTSSQLFEVVWDELSAHANSSPSMPWDSGRLGDYMVHGWIRPDFFPKNVRLRRCDDWWDLFRSLSSDSRLGRRPIRAALYHSRDHLRRYQLRSMNQCRLILESNL